MAARDYQIWAVESLWRYFEQHTGNPVVVMPTGTGKSHVIADFVKSCLVRYPSTRCLVLTHVKELIAQNHSKFMQSWPHAPAGIYSAGLNKKDFRKAVTFAGIASVAKKAHLFGKIDFIIVDECDLVNPDQSTMYAKFMGELKKLNPYIKMIGFTATPWRATFGSITGEDGLFTDTPVDMAGVDAFNWFISEGYLLPLIPKKTNLILDVSGVHMRGGDYVASELQMAVDKREITIKALEETIALGADRKSWLIFASGIEHAKNIAHLLTEMGVTCKAVYSGMTESRDEILRDLKSGKLRAVVNNNVLTTGFDHPGIDMIVILRPCGSSRLWVQMLGRGTRPLFVSGYDLETKDGRLESILESDKQNCLVLDFANNTKKLGPINDPVIPRKKGEGGGEAPVKLCTACGVWNHASARNCSCGHEFVFAVKLKIEASTTELIKKVAPVDFPVVEVFPVDHITYSAHYKSERPTSVKVSYYCGFRCFDEYVCIEHTNHAKTKASQWLSKRTSERPTTSAQLIDIAQTLPVVTHLSVWMNKDGGKYPQIMDYCFDGTAFGKQELALNLPKPAVTTAGGNTAFKLPPPKSTVLSWDTKSSKAPPVDPNWTAYDDMDGDIPF
jgi:DNA repair protein RadD